MKYKIEFVPYIGRLNIKFKKEYETQLEAALDAIGLYTLMLHDSELMYDYSNYGIIFRLDTDGEWIEIDGYE